MSSTAEQTKNKVKKKKREGNFLYDFVRVTGALPTLLYMRIKTIRINKNVPKHVKGGVLIAANHISFLDPVIVHCAFWYRRLHCLATKDLYDTPTRAKFFNAMHCIMVDKDNVSVGMLHSVCDRLKENKAVVIFPEGSVNREEGEVKTYKSGAILMAHLTKKPILPVCIIQRKHWYNRQVVVVGEPIDVNALCGKIPTMEEMEKASAYIREKELELLEFYQNRKNKKKQKESK